MHAGENDDVKAQDDDAVEVSKSCTDFGESRRAVNGPDQSLAEFCSSKTCRPRNGSRDSISNPRHHAGVSRQILQKEDALGEEQESKLDKTFGEIDGLGRCVGNGGEEIPPLAGVPLLCDTAGFVDVARVADPRVLRHVGRGHEEKVDDDEDEIEDGGESESEAKTDAEDFGALLFEKDARGFAEDRVVSAELVLAEMLAIEDESSDVDAGFEIGDRRSVRSHWDFQFSKCRLRTKIIVIGASIIIMKIFIVVVVLYKRCCTFGRGGTLFITIVMK